MRLSRAELRQRYDELRTLVNRWDPIGVMDDPSWPRDEYDCLVGPILRHLEDGASVGTIATFLNEELAGHFGQPVRPERTEGWAREAREWYTRRWPGSESVSQGDVVPVGRRPVGAPPADSLPADIRSCCYRIEGGRDSTGRLFVEFLTERAFPVRHAGWLYYSGDSARSLARARASYSGYSVAPHWYRVNDF